MKLVKVKLKTHYETVNVFMLVLFASAEIKMDSVKVTKGKDSCRGNFLLTSFIPQEKVYTVAALFSIYSILNKNKSHCLKLTFLCSLLYYLTLLLYLSFSHSL